jgi:hypothetical protein
MKPIDLATVREARQILAELARTYPELSQRSPSGRPIWEAQLFEEVKMADTTQIAVRMPNDLLAQVDAYAKAAAQPGLEVTRADAVRMLVAQALSSRKPAARRR